MSTIKDVTDTALWIAAYRAEENERKDALFRDPYARLLIGELGEKLAKRTQGSRYTAWSVIIRTRLIDEFIQKLVVEEKIDTVVNLGAGLDTRPYRLSLSQPVKWIEVDFEKIIQEKSEKLKAEKPLFPLKRFSLDLSIENDRQQFLASFSSINSHQRILVLTEGVVPYLSNTEASALARDLFAHEKFCFWITEYYSPEILKFLRTPKRLKQMENAPFLFYPDDWFEFFKSRGWNQWETKFFGIESLRLGRMPPTPGWLREDDEEGREKIKKFLGYSILKRT